MCLLPARALCLSTAGLTLDLFLSACIVLAGRLCPSGDAPTQDLLLSAFAEAAALLLGPVFLFCLPLSVSQPGKQMLVHGDKTCVEPVVNDS